MITKLQQFIFGVTLLFLSLFYSVTTVKAVNCNAHFNHYPNTHNADSIHFYPAISTCTTYYWSFGDGSPSSSTPAPWHLYASPGTYYVCLYVLDSGVTCTYCDSVKVLGNQTVNCNAHFSHYTVHNPDSVFFYPAITTCSSYSWNFGDGSATSSALHSWHLYASSGTYYVCLTVNDSGTTCTYCDSVKVLANTVNCNAHYYHYPNTHNPDSIHFYPNLANATSYYWVFGDGSPTSTAQSPWHQYASAGTYYACLYVMDSGVACTWCDSIKVMGGTVHCNAHYSHYPNTHNADSIHFYPAITTCSSYYWSFGDGTTSSTSMSPWHQYASAGTYYVCLHVNDSGNTCSWCDSVKVMGTVNCNAHFIHYPNTHNADSIHFYPSSTTGSYYYWNFGDGTNSTNAAPWHLYSPGTYIACLTISTSGVYCTQCDTIIVTGNQLPCNAYFTHYTLTSNLDSVHFNPNNMSGTSYYWYFGDGHTSNHKDPWHVYGALGTYYVCLYVNGTSCHWCDSVKITAVTPPCNTHFAHYSLNNPDSVHFYPTGTTAANYYWSFGDGTTSTSQYPWHYYSTAGRYYVCLHASNTATGYSCYWCDSITVVGNPPPPCNSAFAYYCLGNPDSIHFYAYSGAGTSYWNFGDGSTTSTSQYPWHYFTSTGTYYVCHTSNNAGVYCTSCDSVTLGGTYYVYYRINTSAGADTFLFAQGAGLGINSLYNEKGGLMVYPNPTNSNLIIKTLGAEQLNYIEIQNVLGQVYYSINSTQPTQNIVDVSQYPSGVYFVKAVDTKGKTMNVRFIKQ